jgi:glycosyltransferase involved in cell wall biosynthesis
VINVLSISTLYPNPADPHRGAFLRARLRALREHASRDVDLRVIAPVPYYPRFLPGAARWRRFAAAPRSGEIDGVRALFPRYLAIPTLGVASHVASLARAARGAARAFGPFAPDIVEAHFLFPDGAAAAVLAREIGRPLLLVARGTDAHTFPFDPKLRARIAATLAASTRVAAVSDGLANDLAPLMGGGKRATVIRNGVDAALFRPRPRAETRAALGIGETEVLVLAVGRLTPVKRPELIVEALGALASSSLQNQAPQDDRDIRGVLVGSGELESQVRSIAERAGLFSPLRAGARGPRFEIVREMPPERLALHYAAADVFVHASEREGCPNVVIEALACGTPVAATPSPGVREVFSVAGIEGGVLAPSNDAAGLAFAIRRSLAARFDRAAIAFAAAAAFRWEEVARKTVDLYRETFSR